VGWAYAVLIGRLETEVSMTRISSGLGRRFGSRAAYIMSRGKREKAKRLNLALTKYNRKRRPKGKIKLGHDLEHRHLKRTYQATDDRETEEGVKKGEKEKEGDTCVVGGVCKFMGEWVMTPGRVRKKFEGKPKGKTLGGRRI